MNDWMNTYCRLCAELKPHSQLIDLQYNEETYHKIVNRLARFNVEVNLNVNIFRNTVCFICIKLLDQAFDFVTAVEQAQMTLNDLQNVKRDESDLDEFNISYEHREEDVYVKNEVHEAPSVNNECNFNTICARKLSDPPHESNVDEIKDEVIVNEQADVIVKDDHDEPPDVNNGDDNNIGTEKGNESLTKSLENTDEFLVNKKINRLATLPLKSIKLTWADYSWMCSECETQFPNIEELRIHSIQYHKKCNLYSCIDCKRKILRLKRFLKHVRSHRKYLHYSCYICYTKFSNIPQATKHYKSKHMKSAHICSGCNTNFSSADKLDEHVSAFYKKPVFRRKTPVQWHSDSLTCKVCKKVYSSRSGLSYHMLAHTDRKRDYVCEICGKGFFERVCLDEHRNVHTDLKPHQCEVCKLEFRTVYQLRYHASIHSGEKPFACNQCGRRFRLKNQIIKHSRTHTDSFPYVCTICNKRFRFISTHNTHLRQHTGEKPYSCDICQRDFTDWGNCNKHMKRIHGIDMSKKKRIRDGLAAVEPVVPVTDKVTKRKKEMTEKVTKRKKEMTEPLKQKKSAGSKRNMNKRES